MLKVDRARNLRWLGIFLVCLPTLLSFQSWWSEIQSTYLDD